MVPLPNPSCEARNHRWRRRAGGAKSGRALTKQHILCPKTSFFGPKRLRNPVKTDKRRKIVRTMHVCLDSLVTKHPWFPSKSTMCPRHGPKLAQSAHILCQQPPKPRIGHILGYVAQTLIPRAPSPPVNPHFLGFPTLKIARRHAQTPVPAVTCWSPRAAWALHSGGGGSTMVPAAKRLLFRKDVLTLLGRLKQVVLARFEPVVTRFGPRKILKRLQKGPFWDQKWVKNGP